MAEEKHLYSLALAQFLTSPQFVPICCIPQGLYNRVKAISDRDGNGVIIAWPICSAVRCYYMDIPFTFLFCAPFATAFCSQGHSARGRAESNAENVHSETMT